VTKASLYARMSLFELAHATLFVSGMTLKVGLDLERLLMTRERWFTCARRHCPVQAASSVWMWPMLAPTLADSQPDSGATWAVSRLTWAGHSSRRGNDATALDDLGSLPDLEAHHTTHDPLQSFCLAASLTVAQMSLLTDAY
jgi:hypothetical protein